MRKIGSEQKTHEAHLRIANAVNTMNLFASREVLEHVYALLEYVSSHQDQSYSRQKQDKIIRKIILAIRNDLGGKTSGLVGFEFRMISPGVSEKNKLSDNSSTKLIRDSVGSPHVVDDTRGFLANKPTLSDDLKQQRVQKDKW